MNLILKTLDFNKIFYSLSPKVLMRETTLAKLIMLKVMKVTYLEGAVYWTAVFYCFALPHICSFYYSLVLLSQN